MGSAGAGETMVRLHKPGEEHRPADRLVFDRIRLHS
jgi:hypothetical protein